MRCSNHPRPDRARPGRLLIASRWCSTCGAIEVRLYNNVVWLAPNPTLRVRVRSVLSAVGHVLLRIRRRR